MTLKEFVPVRYGYGRLIGHEMTQRQALAFLHFHGEQVHELLKVLAVHMKAVTIYLRETICPTLEGV